MMDEANPLGVKLGLIFGISYLLITSCLDWWRGIGGEAPFNIILSAVVFTNILFTARQAYTSGFQAAMKAKADESGTQVSGGE